MAEGRSGAGGKILSVTVKRARRVQEKMMQKFGKSDQTRDEVFADFVQNFHRQQTAATRLQKELTKYMNALRVLNQCTRSMCETMTDLYEPEWAGFSNYKDVMEKKLLLWEDQLTSLTSKMVEPMSNYISRFPDVKARISKHDRKVVDYDMRRREVEQLRTKAKVNDQKIQQSEEAYTHAKQLYDEITDELYEELPTFYDSRIQFYATVFEGVASTEYLFHRELTKVDEEWSKVMTGLGEEAATGVHSTKKERGIDSTPKLLSRPEDDSEGSSGSEPATPIQPNSTHHEPPATPTESVEVVTKETTPSHTPSPSLDTTPQTTPNSSMRSSYSDKEKLPPKPAPFSGSLRRQTPTQTGHDSNESTSPIGDVATATPQQQASESPLPPEATLPESTPAEITPPPPPPTAAAPAAIIADQKTPPVPHFAIPPPPTTSPEEEPLSPRGKTPPPKPAKFVPDLHDDVIVPEKLEEPVNGTKDATPPAVEETIEDSTESGRKVTSLPDNVLYKVTATHPYDGEDEDELSFDKGDIIVVVPFDDPDEEEDEGWSMGVSEKTLRKGMFPDNFTKRLE